MDLDCALFDEPNDDPLENILSGIRFAVLKFSGIHSTLTIRNQVPNAHETYLPVSLFSTTGIDINVNDLFISDYLAPGTSASARYTSVKPKTLVIYGSRGAGKTALVRYLKYQWILEQDSVKGIKDFKWVALIDTKKPSTTKAFSFLFESVAAYYFPRKYHSQDIYECFKDTKLLIMVDSFEHASCSLKQFLWKVYGMFTNTTVLITCHSNHANSVEEMLQVAKVDCKTLRIKPLTLQTWKLMVPKMVSAKTKRTAVSDEIVERIISRFEARPPLLPSDLATSINIWMEENYPQYFHPDNVYALDDGIMDNAYAVDDDIMDEAVGAAAALY